MAFAALAASAAATVAGGVLSYKGAKESAAAKENMYNYQSQIAENNALIENRNAQQELQTGEEKAGILGMANRQRVGAIRAAQGASGVAVDQGSNADVVKGQELAGRTDQAITRETAGRKGTDYLTRAYGELTQSALDKMGAEQAETEGTIKEWTSIVGTVGSVADKWMNYAKMG